MALTGGQGKVKFSQIEGEPSDNAALDAALTAASGGGGGGGAISLFVYRNLYSVPNPIVNVGGIGVNTALGNTGVRIYNGTALWVMYRGSATTATTIAGTLNIIER